MRQLLFCWHNGFYAALLLGCDRKRKPRVLLATERESSFELLRNPESPWKSSFSVWHSCWFARRSSGRSATATIPISTLWRRRSRPGWSVVPRLRIVATVSGRATTAATSTSWIARTLASKTSPRCRIYLMRPKYVDNKIKIAIFDRGAVFCLYFQYSCKNHSDLSLWYYLSLWKFR